MKKYIKKVLFRILVLIFYFIWILSTVTGVIPLFIFIFFGFNWVDESPNMLEKIKNYEENQKE